MVNNKYMLILAILAWINLIECSDFFQNNQSIRPRRSIQPVSLQNVSSILVGYNYNSLSSINNPRGYHVNQATRTNEQHARGLRKINLLGNLFQKRQPLYLLNGTVCRFVNSVPICTTLSTTGVLPPSSGSGGGGSGGGGGGGGGGSTPARPAGPSPSPSAQGSGGQSTPSPAPRPASLLDDNSEDINVNGLNTAQLLGNNDHNQAYQLNQAQQQQNLQPQQQQQRQQQLNQQQVSNLSPSSSNNQQQQTLQQQPSAVQLVQTEARPFGYLVQRRPGPFTLRRPQFRPISVAPATS